VQNREHEEKGAKLVAIQRHVAVIALCKQNNRKHHELFAFSKRERERVEREHLTGQFLVREDKVLSRIERRDAISQPWEDCVLRADRLAPLPK
jgi:hypothetical protein